MESILFSGEKIMPVKLRREIVSYTGEITSIDSINPQTIMVDCMDTIIARKITLERLLEKWSYALEKEFEVYSGYLYRYRLGVMAGNMHNKISIDSIYSDIADQCIYYGSLQAADKQNFCDRAGEIELDLEINNHRLIKETIEVICDEKEKGKEIICLSDFRLPASSIHIFFREFGIDNLFNLIVSSCDVGMTKKDGKLYDYIIDQKRIDTDRCIMIGDNIQSDCKNAYLRGIQPFLVR